MFVNTRSEKLKKSSILQTNQYTNSALQIKLKNERAVNTILLCYGEYAVNPIIYHTVVNLILYTI